MSSTENQPIKRSKTTYAPWKSKVQQPKGKKRIKNEALALAVTSYFSKHDIPHYHIEDKDLRSLLGISGGALNRQELASSMKKTCKKGQAALRSEFQKIECKVSLTCDSWTSYGNLSFFGVSAHWISSNYELKSVLLDARLSEEGYSGDALATQLVTVLENFKINKQLFCITLPDASIYTTMAAHLSNLIGFDNENCLLPSLTHIIDFTAQLGLDGFCKTVVNPLKATNRSPTQENSSTAIDRINDLVALLKQERKHSAAFDDVTQLMMDTNIPQIPESGTGWNSTFLMLQWASTLKDPINAFCKKTMAASHYIVSPNEWQRIEQLCDFLEPLHAASIAISKSKIRSLMSEGPIFIWMIKKIHEVFQKYDSDQNLLPAANKMHHNLLQHFGNLTKKPIFLCALILDPRIKTNQFTTEMLTLMKLSKEEMINKFKNSANEFINNNRINSKEEMCQDETIFPQGLYERKRQKLSSPDEEIDAYLNNGEEEVEVEDKSCDPLTYWKLNSQKFPILSKMASSYLSIPASSCVPSKDTLSLFERNIQGSQTTDYSFIEAFLSKLHLKDWINHHEIDIWNIESYH